MSPQVCCRGSQPNLGFGGLKASPNRAGEFEPAAAVPTHHLMIFTSEDENGTEWFHTRGMRKSGRPDLSIHRVTADLRDGIIDLFNRFIEYQAFGGVIAEGRRS